MMAKIGTYNLHMLDKQKGHFVKGKGRLLLVLLFKNPMSTNFRTSFSLQLLQMNPQYITNITNSFETLK